MSLFALLPMVMPAVEKVLELIPDENERARARDNLLLEVAKLEAEQNLGQLELNKAEAQHNSIFVAGWRPFIGWVGGVSLAWTFLVQPMAVWAATIAGYSGSFPELQSGELLSLVMAMLGVGAMRSFDKLNGVSTEKIGAPKPQTKPKYND